MHLSTVQKRSAEFHHSAENPKPTRTQLNAGSIYLVSENDPPGVRGGDRDKPPHSAVCQHVIVRPTTHRTNSPRSRCPPPQPARVARRPCKPSPGPDLRASRSQARSSHYISDDRVGAEPAEMDGHHAALRGAVAPA